MGGGRQGLVTNTTATPDDPIDSWGCDRRDGRNLLKTYIEDKTKRGLKHSIVKNNKELQDLDIDNTDYLFGNSLYCFYIVVSKKVISGRS